MFKFVLLRLTTVYLLITLCIASSYEEKTVYTQALLKVKYGPKETKFDANGKYAENSPKSKASGILYYAGAGRDWCKEFPKQPTDNVWIALIPRENNSCPDSQKISVAKKLNASAVILFNSVGSDIPVIKDPTFNKVTVIIDLKSGKDLINLIENHPPVTCNILVGTHYVDRRWKVSRTSVLFVLVSFILLMCISLAWLVFYYVQRFRHIYRNDRKEKQLLSAAKKAISKLKTRGFQDPQKEEAEEGCAVCLENYKDGETLRILPCKHEFHKGCIDPWLLNHRTCPMCKSNILKSLGVDIPEGASANEIDSESAPNFNQTLQPDPIESEILCRNIRIAGLSSTPVVVVISGGDPVPQAWPEEPVEGASASSSSVPETQPAIRYSSSSAASDTDSERSTVALVGYGRRV